MGDAFNEVLDDLCSRFLLNVPEEEREDVIRLCFQGELLKEPHVQP